MFVHGEGKTDLADKILTVTSFVFGVILAFAISNRNSRLSSIKEKLREQYKKDFTIKQGIKLSLEIFEEIQGKGFNIDKFELIFIKKDNKKIERKEGAEIKEM